ncbi:MAG TPA: SURF1 family protein [Burkholderiaceae bacterium]|nr:SURF1 family protein [Burkholderiaceae bacterium]
MPRSKLIFAWIAAAIGVAVAISLGNWQTRRGDAKVILQAQADAADRAAPIDIASRSSIESVAASLPRKVRVTGSFDPVGTVLLDNRIVNGVTGYQVITPLVIGNGLPAVLIERGWKPRGAGPDTHVLPPPPLGQVTIEGLAVARPATLLELGGAPTLKVPGVWQNLDYDVYEKAAKRAVARFVVRQSAASDVADSLRREWPQPASGVDKHRGYAFQWYALAGLICVLAGYLGWKTWRAR